MRTFLPLLLSALALAFPAAAQVYKWTDSQGKVHYGDRPPDDARKQELRIRVPTYEGPVQVQDWSAVIRKKGPAAAAPDAGQVTMYATQWCGVCKRARAYFAAQGVRYREIDVDESEAGRREFEAYGGRGVPLILVGDKVMRGFSEKGFEKLRRGG